MKGLVLAEQHRQQTVSVAEDYQLKRILPEWSKGMSLTLTSPDSPQLIEGVCVQPIALWPDDSR
jgi:hypothetical protein